MLFLRFVDFFENPCKIYLCGTENQSLLLHFSDKCCIIYNIFKVIKRIGAVLSIKAVIFDLDGTLLNTLEDLANAVNFALAQKGFPTHKVEAFKLFVGNGTDIMITRALPEESRSASVLDALRELYFEYYNRHSGECTRPYDGITKLLNNLKAKGLALAVVSNKIDFMAQSVVKEYFGDIFDFVTGQRDGAAPKPDPSMVFEALKRLNVSAEECLFVGDSGVDAETGVNSGTHPIGVLWGFRGEEELKKCGAEAVISSPEQLLKYI